MDFSEIFELLEFVFDVYKKISSILSYDQLGSFLKLKVSSHYHDLRVFLPVSPPVLYNPPGKDKAKNKQKEKEI